MRYLIPLNAALILTAVFVPETAASAPGKSATMEDARSEAVSALKAGDALKALNALRGVAGRGSQAPAEDTQLVAALCSLAREMEAKEPGRGRPAAVLAVEEARRARPKQSPREAALTDLALGEISELMLGDHDRARSHYESALAQGATGAAARRGLDRLAWRRAMIDAKAAESSSLRNRKL